MSSDAEVLELAPQHIKQLAAIGQDTKGHGKIDVAKYSQSLERSQNTLKYLSRNSHSPKWPSHVCKLLSHTRCFHLEEVDDATREAARGEMRCNLCGTEETQCNIVVHLGGDLDGYDADTFFKSDSGGLRDAYKKVVSEKPGYLGVLVPGTSCLGLIVKTITANNFIYNAIDRAGNDLAADTLKIAKLWDRLTYSNRRASDYFYQLVSKDDDCTPEFEAIFDQFVTGVVARLPDNTRAREKWLEVFRAGKKITESNLNRLTCVAHRRDRVEIEIEDSEDDDSEEEDDFIVSDDEEEEEEEEEEDEEVQAPVRRTRRRVVEETSDEDEEEGGPVEMGFGEPLPEPERVTRLGKRQRQQREAAQERQKQQDLLVASAAPSRAAASALRQHPGNVLHSRVSTLQDLLKYASSVVEGNTADTVTLLEAAAVISKLLDAKKRGIHYEINISYTCKALSQLQTKLVTMGSVSETSPITAALLVLSEFVQ